MKTRAAYNRQVELLRKCTLSFEENGHIYPIAQIVLRKNEDGQGTIYRLYSMTVSEAGTVNHYRDVPGDYPLTVKRMLQKPDLFRYLILVSAPVLTFLTIYLWLRAIDFRLAGMVTNVLAAGVTIVTIICWQMFREHWL